MKRVMLTLIVIYWILTVLVFYVKFRIFLVGESRTDLMYVDPDRIIFCCRSGLLLGELDLEKTVCFWKPGSCCGKSCYLKCA